MFYSNNNYYIKVYNFNIISSKKSKKINKYVNRKLNKLIYRTSIDNGNIDFNFYKLFSKKFIFNLKRNRYKPKIKFNGELSYSLFDSFNTAIFYGILSTLFSFIYCGLNIPFKVKKSKLNIKPVFKDTFSINFYCKSIIFLSLGKVIYMLVIFLKTYLQVKEVTLFKGRL
ncbi:DUF2953 domain-containing protein [Clostridium baratii]|uniref:DUF2953 domain-containing protein n=1 Tax=Clostridium baratii TaxID=1561 RepID=UPI003BB02F48